MNVRVFFRPFLRLTRVLSDAVDVMMFRSSVVNPAPYESDTFRAAAGLFAVGLVISLRADGMPFYGALALAAVGVWFALNWAKASTESAARAYLVVAPGSFALLMCSMSRTLELLVAVWYFASLFFALRRRSGLE